jgi:hypothetical protein
MDPWPRIGSFSASGRASGLHEAELCALLIRCSRGTGSSILALAEGAGPPPGGLENWEAGEIRRCPRNGSGVCNSAESH